MEVISRIVMKRNSINDFIAVDLSDSYVEIILKMIASKAII